MPEAIEAIGYLLGAYPGKQAPDSYIGTLAALLCKYPKQVAIECTDPLRGVARKCKFMPTVADVVAWCEPETDRIYRHVARENLIEQQRLERSEREAKPDQSGSRAAMLERVRREMQAAGMPIMGDYRLEEIETPDQVKRRLGISDEQWDALPAGPCGTWRRLGQA